MQPLGSPVDMARLSITSANEEWQSCADNMSWISGGGAWGLRYDIACKAGRQAAALPHCVQDRHLVHFVAT